MAKKIPIIDLFSGPGGLGEGFSSVSQKNGDPVFSIKLSIEKDIFACKTLSLRTAYRYLKQVGILDDYYEYIRGNIDRSTLESLPKIKEAIDLAYFEVRKATLGETPDSEIDQWIIEGIKNEENWVLIGGPPCQAYSLAGRSRMKNKDPYAFEQDQRHLLYKEYLRIIKKHKPAVFVMENVKGILSSKHAGSLIFEKILSDLSSSSDETSYKLRSFVIDNESDKDLQPKDFIIYAEEYGIPQARHRVIILGIRKDLASHKLITLKKTPPLTVEQTIGNLPKLRSHISREVDSYEKWYNTLKDTLNKLKDCNIPKDLHSIVEMAISQTTPSQSTGKNFMVSDLDYSKMPNELSAWISDKQLGGVIQHVSRGHMSSDLQRYLFAASYAKNNHTSPKIRQFPHLLLPKHKNIHDTTVPFEDRFRVQLKDCPSTTVVSHISKDGHYYIHYDPSQCRSLTVREAARLQTFPDNYFFEGNRTQQYVQVGNAVPPLLAKQLAEIVARLFE